MTLRTSNTLTRHARSAMQQKLFEQGACLWTVLGGVAVVLPSSPSE